MYKVEFLDLVENLTQAGKTFSSAKKNIKKNKKYNKQYLIVFVLSGKALVCQITVIFLVVEHFVSDLLRWNIYQPKNAPLLFLIGRCFTYLIMNKYSFLMAMPKTRRVGGKRHVLNDLTTHYKTFTTEVRLYRVLSPQFLRFPCSLEILSQSLFFILLC